jgi:hypothetical protein
MGAETTAGFGAHAKGAAAALEKGADFPCGRDIGETYKIIRFAGKQKGRTAVAFLAAEPDPGDRPRLPGFRVEEYVAEAFGDGREEPVAVSHTNVGKNRNAVLVSTLINWAEDRRGAERDTPPLQRLLWPPFRSAGFNRDKRQKQRRGEETLD